MARQNSRNASNAIAPALNALLLLVCLSVLVGCSDSGAPRIRVFDGSAPSSRNAGPSVQGPIAEIQNGSFHVVRDAETLYSIARGYGVSTRDLISANGLKPPYLLLKGQRLTIPASRIHRVQSGETVYGISRLYGVDMSQLVQRNNINPPFTIRVGQRLVIPGRVVDAQSVAALPRESEPESEPVVRFETKLTEEERRKLAEEPLDAPLAATPRAEVPQAPLAGGPRAPRQADAGGAASQQVAAAPEPQRGFSVSADGFPRPRVKPAGVSQVAIAGPKIVPRPEARSKDTFLWPVQGRVISSYGPKPGGLHNDGVNIAAPRGTSVRAAENGVVVYAGSDLKGFGNMVLVKHADGYVTAYAHTADVLVRRGDRVRRGQAIARVGSSGNVDRPQLHFEIRKGRKAINPQGRLGA